MNYTGPTTNFDDVIQHLRNKNLAVFPASRGRLVKLTERLQRRIGRMHWNAIRSAGWQVIVSEQVVEGPLVLRHIRETDRRILDFGGYESVLPLQLSALGHPRQQARFLCGLSSPATGKARLGKHPLSGALEDRRFADVLAWCELLG